MVAFTFAFASALGFPPCTFERLSVLHVICYQGRLHAAADSSARPLCSFLHIDWGILIFETLLGDSGSGFYVRLFMPL
jgi:hypothetical protein